MQKCDVTLIVAELLLRNLPQRGRQEEHLSSFFRRISCETVTAVMICEDKNRERPFLYRPLSCFLADAVYIGSENSENKRCNVLK